MPQPPSVFAARLRDAVENFVENVMEQFGKTEAEAQHVLNVYMAARVVKLNLAMGRYDLRHGAFWEQGPIDRACEIET